MLSKTSKRRATRLLSGRPWLKVSKISWMLGDFWVGMRDDGCAKVASEAQANFWGSFDMAGGRGESGSMKPARVARFQAVSL